MRRAGTARRPALRAGAAALLLAGAAAALAPAASARDQDLVRAHRSLYPAAELAAGRASGPSAVQDAYDAARDLQEAVRRAAPVSAECRPLLSALARYSAGRVRQMEGVDRPSPSDQASGRRAADGQRAAVASAAGSCRGAGGGARGPRSP